MLYRELVILPNLDIKGFINHERRLILQQLWKMFNYVRSP